MQAFYICYLKFCLALNSYKKLLITIEVSLKFFHCHLDLTWFGTNLRTYNTGFTELIHDSCGTVKPIL